MRIIFLHSSIIVNPNVPEIGRRLASFLCLSCLCFVSVAESQTVLLLLLLLLNSGSSSVYRRRVMWAMMLGMSPKYFSIF
jgi:hypothetical protein